MGLGLQTMLRLRDQSMGVDSQQRSIPRRRTTFREESTPLSMLQLRPAGCLPQLSRDDRRTSGLLPETSLIGTRRQDPSGTEPPLRLTTTKRNMCRPRPVRTGSTTGSTNPRLSMANQGHYPGCPHHLHQPRLEAGCIDSQVRAVLAKRWMTRKRSTMAARRVNCEALVRRESELSDLMTHV